MCAGADADVADLYRIAFLIWQKPFSQMFRKIFRMDKETLNTYMDELGTTLGEALLAPTRIYVGALKSIKNAGVRVKACSHITGGGFYENIPRMLPEGKHAVVEKNSYPVPPGSEAALSSSQKSVSIISSAAPRL